MHQNLFSPETNLLQPSYDLAQLARVLLPPYGGYNKCFFIEKTVSTNLDLIDLAKNNPPNWPDLSVYFTQHQTNGIGRFARKWESPPHTNIAVSLCLKPYLQNKFVNMEQIFSWISLLAGIALVDCLRNLQVDNVWLKWPNDVLCIHKNGEEFKLAGILSHLTEDISGEKFLVVGVGINVNTTQLQLGDLAATSLFLENSVTKNIQTVLLAYLRAFLLRYRSLVSSKETLKNSVLLQDFRSYCVTLGRKIVVEFPNKLFLQAQAIDVDDFGCLLLLLEDGSYKKISAGDVMHVLAADNEKGL